MNIESIDGTELTTRLYEIKTNPKNIITVVDDNVHETEQ